MILLPNCGCCGCPCGPGTLPWDEEHNVAMSIGFSGGSVGICQNEGTPLAFIESGLPPGHPYYCQYSSDYDVTINDQPCTVTIYYVVSGPNCTLGVTGWSPSCDVTVTVSVDGGPCS
jgi:hypothetical protein